MTDVATMDGPGANPARRRKVATVTATELGAHLDMTRQRVSAMVEEGIIRREPDGRFVLGECRVAYLRWLRDPARRAVKSAAETKFLEQRTMALEIRNLQRLGDLIPREVAEEVLDVFVATTTTEILTIGARVAPLDLALRRKVDAVVHNVRKSIHARLGEKLAEFEREGADAADD